MDKLKMEVHEICSAIQGVLQWNIELWLLDIKHEQCGKLVLVTCGGMSVGFFSNAEDVIKK